MSNSKEKILNLLSEIDTICNNNKINYFIGGETLLSILKDGQLPENTFYATVLMTAEECFKFMKAVNKENSPNRYLESMYNNPNFNRLVLRYVDESTTFVPLTTYGCYQHLGLAVNIEVIRKNPVSKLKKFFCLAFESGWEGSAIRLWHSKKKILCSYVVNFISAILGKKNTARLIFNMLMRSSIRSKNNKCFTKQFWKKEIPFPNYFFSKSIKSNLNDRTFNIPLYSNNYIKKIYGANWKNYNLTCDTTLKYIIDPDLPYSEYLNMLKENNMDINDCWNSKKMFYKKNAVVKKYNDIIGKSWGVIQRSGDRMDLWEVYMPQKDELISLYNQARFEELNKKFKYMQTVVDRNAKNNLGICFDKEIFEIFCSTLAYYGKKKYADKLRSIVPAEYWKPIQITKINEKGEYVIEESPTK